MIPIGFYPLGIPVYTDELTRKYYNFIEGIPDGSPVCIHQHSFPATFPSMGVPIQDSLYRLWQKNCKVLFWSGMVDAPPVTEQMIEYAKKKIISEGRPEPIYGVDYVDLGYIAGNELAVAAVANDFREASGGVDRYGNSLDDLSMMENLYNGGDVVACIIPANLDFPVQFLRQWQEKFGTPCVITCNEMIRPGIMPYINSGQYSGAIAGTQPEAAFELLLGYAGEAARMTDAISLLTVFVLILIVLGNIVSLSRRGGTN